MSKQQQYMPTKAYFELSNADKAALKAEADALHRVMDNPNSPWVERTRAETRFREIERTLQSDAMGRRQREQIGNQDAGPRLIRSDDGKAYLVSQPLNELVK